MTSTTRRTNTLKHARTLASLVAAGALLAVPATGMAAKPATKGKPATTGKASAKKCKAQKMPFNVSGTFVSAVADDPATPASEATVTLMITGANLHARNSGELTDMNAAKKGMQAKGGTYTVPAGDAYVLRANGYDAGELPVAGDRVHVRGKVTLTKKRCAAPGTSTADRYGAVDIKKVTLSDRDPAPVPAPVS